MEWGLTGKPSTAGSSPIITVPVDPEESPCCMPTATISAWELHSLEAMRAHPASQTCCSSSSGEAWSRDVQTQPSPCCIRSETDIPDISHAPHANDGNSRQRSPTSLHPIPDRYPGTVTFLQPAHRTIVERVEWARCSTRPETNLSPARSPLALTAYDTGSARGGSLYSTDHPTLRLTNNLKLITLHPHYLSLLSVPFYYSLPLLHRSLTNTLTCIYLPPPHGHNASDWAGSITGR